MDVVVYTSKTCGYCNAVKEYLRNKGVSFIEKNVSADPEAMQELVSKGFMSVPVVCVGEETIVGFNRGKLDQLLEQKGR